MENKELGRLVLKQVTEYPETFNMSHWGDPDPCGTTACLAGHTLLLSGYELVAYEVFSRPDGSITTHIGGEAAQLLGMVPGERSVFSESYEKAAIERFRAMLDD